MSVALMISKKNRNLIKKNGTNFSKNPVAKVQIKCDYCSGACSKAAADAGEAAEKARQAGWDTVKVGKVGAPRKWACPTCLKDPKTFA